MDLFISLGTRICSDTKLHCRCSTAFSSMLRLQNIVAKGRHLYLHHLKMLLCTLILHLNYFRGVMDFNIQIRRNETVSFTTFIRIKHLSCHYKIDIMVPWIMTQHDVIYLRGPRKWWMTVLKRIFEYSNIFFRILIFVFDSWTFSESEYYSNIRIFWSEYSEII